MLFTNLELQSSTCVVSESRRISSLKSSAIAEVPQMIIDSTGVGAPGRMRKNDKGNRDGEFKLHY
jgi:hypothetical protein